jgi:hypothetical protein
MSELNFTVKLTFMPEGSLHPMGVTSNLNRLLEDAVHRELLTLNLEGHMLVSEVEVGLVR